MDEIIKKLQEFNADIKCDIKSDWITKEELNKSIMQSIALSQAICILQNIGENNNIKK